MRALCRDLYIWIGGGIRIFGKMKRGAALCGAALLLAAPVAAEIVSARYEGPTARYPHGVLGDDLEWERLVVGLSGGREVAAEWARPVVFEDLAPRLWDMDGDGQAEIVTIESHEDLGARMAFWSVEGESLTPLAHLPWIGQRFRWLAPIGAADLDGDGFVEFAYIDRPHLARTLRIWRYLPQEGGGVQLEEVTSIAGLTNHRIGEDFISGGLRDCGDGPELVTANADWSRVMVTTLSSDGMAHARDNGPFSTSRLAEALACGG